MLSETNNYADTSSWLPLDGLAPGFDANKAELSNALDGQSVVLVREGAAAAYRFEAGTVFGPETRAAGAGYEAIEVDAGLFYVQFAAAPSADSVPAATSLLLDLARGHALGVHSHIDGAAPGRTAVGQDFTVWRIEGTPAVGAAPAPSSSLLGRRVMWTYSAVHAYEHIYLSPELYTWQCLAGPEKGLADTDQCTYYQLRPGIFVFAWREKVIPCASVTVADHRDPGAMRAHGVLFGTGDDGSGTTHFTFGAYGRLLSQTVQP